MTYRLRHSWKGSVETESTVLRDRYVRRGYELEKPSEPVSKSAKQDDHRKRSDPDGGGRRGTADLRDGGKGKRAGSDRPKGR